MCYLSKAGSSQFTHCANSARLSSTASPRNRLPDAASLVSCAKPESIGGNVDSPFLRDHTVDRATSQPADDVGGGCSSAVP